MNEGGLRDWFGKSKSKDGKSGWVNVKTGGTCASDEPGEGTPKCVSSSKRASMSKAERESASRRKKAADPGQQSKTNAAKPTYVSTDKKKMKKESIEIQEMGGKGDKPIKVNLKDLVNKTKNNPKNKNLGVKTIDTDTTVHTEESELDRLKAILKSGMMNGKKLTPQQRQGMEAGISQGQGMSQQKEGKSYADFMAEGKGRLTSSNDMQSKMYADKNKSGKKMSDDEIKKEKGGKDFLARLKAAKEKMKKESIEEKVNLKDKSSQYARSTKEVDTAMTDHVNRKRGTHYGKDGKVTEVGRYRRQSKREARNELISMNKESKSFSQFQQECWKTHKKVGMKMKGGKLVPDCRPKNEEVEIIDEKKSPAWQRKAGKSESGGLNAKGVASYRAANPGSKLKTAVTTKPSKLKKGSKSANRRKSFCKRMTGMKKKLTSAKTARDPDSRINKALRKWNC